MTKSTTLYSNNARALLMNSLGTGTTTITVNNVSIFPTISDSTQHFMVTLDDGVNVEIVKVTGISGSDFINCVRAQEGTTAHSFSPGAKVENRLTAGNITKFARREDRLDDVASIENLSDPSGLNGNSRFCASTDSGGTPIIALVNGTKWKLLNYPDVIKTGAVGATFTTTSMNVANIGTYLIDSTAKVYVVQFTSGANIGQCRFVTTIAAGSISWATALPTALSTGDTFEIYRSAYSLKVPTGGQTDRIFFENDININFDYTIPTGRNASSTGPVNIASGVTITIPSGSAWSIV